ncbi:MAG TPA: TonB family protein, partial [Candidatus Binataceae bacterium]|nr:TonB family protein [Candidatus Binataceae bacterium]
ALLVERSAPPPPELAPAQVRIVEMPPTAGLQGGAAPAAPAKVQASKPKPHVRVRRAVVPPVRIHHMAKPEAPPVPASPYGTAKPAARPAAPSAPSASGASAGSAGVAGGHGSGAGAGIGSDSGGARAIFAPTPTIPDDMREQPFEAVAVAHFKVTFDGQVQVSLTTPTENPRLNEILLDALKQWRFFPAMKSGVPVDSQFDVRIPITVQ